MSQDKSGIKITETDDKVMIRGGENFAEKASATKEILQHLELDSQKKVSVLLSTKTKNFQSTYFLIRQKIIEERLEDVQLFLTNHSGASFRQRVDEEDRLHIQTKDYVLHSNPYKKSIYIHTTQSGKVFANESVAKEIKTALALEKPSDVTFHFSKGKNEKHDAYVKRIQNLMQYFMREAIELYSINQLNFSIGSQDAPERICTCVRNEGSLALICVDKIDLNMKFYNKQKQKNKNINMGAFQNTRV